MQHAAEIAALRNDKTKRPICCRYRSGVKMKRVLTQAIKTELMRSKKLNSYQFCVFEIP